MLSYDGELRRLLARERADELARNVRLARGPVGYDRQPGPMRKLGARLLPLVGSLRRQPQRRAPAYRA